MYEACYCRCILCRWRVISQDRRARTGGQAHEIVQVLESKRLASKRPRGRRRRPPRNQIDESIEPRIQSVDAIEVHGQVACVHLGKASSSIRTTAAMISVLSFAQDLWPFVGAFESVTQTHDPGGNSRTSPE